jgi:hypothetical protein
MKQKTPERDEADEGIAALLDALAVVDMSLEGIAEGVPVTKEWASDASKAINCAVAFILETRNADALTVNLIALQEMLLNRAVEERDAARAELERVRGQ